MYDNASKSAWISEAHSLRQRLRALEKQSGGSSQPNGDGVPLPNSLTDLAREVEEAAVDRQRLAGELVESLQQIKLMTASLNKMSASMAAGNPQIVSVPQEGAEFIASLKHSQRESAERLLSQEVSASVRRVDEWESAAGSNKNAAVEQTSHHQQRPATTPGRPSSRRLSRTNSESGVAPEVREFEEFVDRTGALGGWDPRDHEQFCKLLARVDNNYSAVVQLALEEIPTVSRVDVVRHCRWHAEHEELLEKRRAAVQRWRVAKEVGKAQARSKVEAESVHRARREREKRSEIEQEERAEREAKLAQWKAEKEAASSALRAAEAAAQAEKKAEAERQRLTQKASDLLTASCAHAQELIAQKEEQKRLEQNRDLQAKAMKEDQKRALEAANREELKRRQDMVMQTLRTMSEARVAEQKAREEREARQQKYLKKLEVTASRDPHRLLRETVSERMRRAENEGKDGTAERLFESKVVNWRANQSRAVPLWRQQLAG
eukprot:jgi/Chlat1/5587/Chrsp369S05369